LGDFNIDRLGDRCIDFADRAAAELATSGVIAGIGWVTADRVRLGTTNTAVANMSLGGGADAAEDLAVQNSISTGRIAYSISAGNDAANACNVSPARVPEAMTIAASDINDASWASTNRGACVDWYAPGVNILSAGIASNTATATFTGTSMASPHTAGAAAVYLETHRTSAPATVASALSLATTSNTLTGVPIGTVNKLLYSGYTGRTDVLGVVEKLTGGQNLYSNDGRYSAEMQSDGNFVIYKPGHIAVWSTQTNGNTGARIEMQIDGNLVVYNTSNVAKWSSGTNGRTGAILRMQDDCNLVLYQPGFVARWASARTAAENAHRPRSERTSEAGPVALVTSGRTSGSRRPRSRCGWCSRRTCSPRTRSRSRTRAPSRRGTAPATSNRSVRSAPR
jgi:subtilisin family serine protease